jgi:serine/threonine protein kinase
LGLATGTKLGSYEIVAGGMGEVYHARDAKLDRDVAVKVPCYVDGGDPRAIGPEGMVSGIVSPVRNLSELYLIEGLK